MAEHDINELIGTGDYVLSLPPGLGIEEGEGLAYRVVEGGVVQEDGSIPMVIRIRSPARLKGVQTRAKLVPQTPKDFQQVLRAMRIRVPAVGDA